MAPVGMPAARGHAALPVPSLGGALLSRAFASPHTPQGPRRITAVITCVGAGWRLFARARRPGSASRLSRPLHARLNAPGGKGSRQALARAVGVAPAPCGLPRGA